MPTYLTAVFEINDPNSFAEQRKELCNKLGESFDGNVLPWTVTALSTKDEISKLDQIENIVNWHSETEEEPSSYQKMELIKELLSS